MAASQQHADRAAHRVPDGDHRLDTKRFEQRRSVVGDVFQLEVSSVDAGHDRDRGSRR